MKMSAFRDFRCANLRCAHLKNEVIAGGDFRCACLFRADLREVDGAGCDFRCADLRGANLAGGRFRGSDFRCADLQGADLAGSDLRGADFSGANLSGTPLSSAWPVDFDGDAWAAAGGWIAPPKEVVGYVSRIPGDHTRGRYKLGEEIVAPFFSGDRGSPLHPGLYFWSTPVLASLVTQSRHEIVIVNAAQGDTVIVGAGLARCRKFTVVGRADG